MPDYVITGPADQHEALFASLTSMTRGLAQLAAGSNLRVLSELDRLLAQGWVVRVEFSLGSAGPLGLGFVLHSLDGTTSHLMGMDAPPSASAFRFDGLDR